MKRWRRWTLSAGTLGMLGVTAAATSGVVALARRFVDELSRPGVALNTAHALTEWRVPQAVPEPPPERQRTLSFRAADGTMLRGEFWAQPVPAPTVVVCHGYRVGRALLRPVAALAYQDGLNALLFDFRGHGESTQVATSGGNAEVRDLTAALEVAAQQPESLPGKLFVHGFSMGAAVALLAAPHQHVAGIIADSPYARNDDVLCQMFLWQLRKDSAGWPPRLHWLRRSFPVVARATFAASDLIFRFRYHHALLARPDAHLRSWGRRSWLRRARCTSVDGRPGHRGLRHVPILLIHALRDPLIPVEHAHRIALAARASGVPIEVYLPDVGIHCGAYGHDPQRYASILKSFVTRACEEREACEDAAVRTVGSPQGLGLSALVTPSTTPSMTPGQGYASAS